MGYFLGILNRKSGLQILVSHFSAERTKSEPLCTIPAYIVEQASGFTVTNNLTAFLLTCFKEEEVKRVVSLYHIGTTAKGHTIFFQFDIQGRCRGGKIIPYDPETGHRIKDELGWWPSV